MKGTAGTSTTLDVCLPPTFFFFFPFIRRGKNVAYFILLPDQSDTSLFSVLGFEVAFCSLSNKEIKHTCHADIPLQMPAFIVR